MNENSQDPTEQNPDDLPQAPPSALDSFKTIVQEECIWLLQTAGQVIALIITTRVVTWLTKSAGIDLNTILSGNWQKKVEDAVDDRTRGDNGTTKTNLH